MPSSDLNLLFGMLALQLDFITRDQLLTGMQAWVHDKAKPLGAILRDQGALADDRLQLLDALVQKHLEAHNNDPQESIAALSSRSSAEEGLEGLGDAEVLATLAVVRERRAAEAAKPIGIETIAPPDSDGRFRILRQHDKGGLGVVYLAHDREVNRQVALKEIRTDRSGDLESRQRFMLEAEICPPLRNICRFSGLNC